MTMILDASRPLLTGGVCVFHGWHDGHPCPRCAADAERAALLDALPDKIADLEQQLAEQLDAHNALAFEVADLARRLREAEALLLRLTERSA